LRILVDMLTPKQVLLLGELSNRLEDAGHKVVRVTRAFRETLELLRLRKIRAKIIGSHRTTLEGKLQESLRRTARLAELMKTLKIDLVVAYPSVEAARAAFGLSIPYYCLSDSPHAEAVSKLTVPLARRLFTPAMIPKEDWLRFGISSEEIIQYNALDPYVWIRDAKPDPKMLHRLDLEPDSKIVTLRLEESFAAYLMNRSGDWRNLGPRILEELLKRGCEARIVVLPRYKDHYRLLRNLRRKVIVPRDVVYGAALLASTSVFVGGGGTMTVEAALIGVPTICYFPAGPTRVESYLQEKSLLTRSTDPASIAEQVLNWLDDEKYSAVCRMRAHELLQTMEDPLKVIMDNIG
jgi:predicted glycosyltransferase